MQLRVYYKNVRIKIESGVVVSEDGRHEIDNATGFVIYYNTIRPEIPKVALPFKLPLNIPAGTLLTDKDVDMIVDICKDMKGG